MCKGSMARFALPAGAVHETAVDENQGRAASIRGSSCLSHLSTFLPLSPRDKTAFRFNDIGYEPCVYGANGSFYKELWRSYKRTLFSELPSRVLLGNQRYRRYQPNA